MLFEVTEKGLTLKVEPDDHGTKEALAQYDGDEIDTDKVMYEFFDDILANSEYEWGIAEEIGVLTSAPILITRDENEEVSEAYGFMDYAIASVLGELRDCGEAFFQRG